MLVATVTLNWTDPTARVDVPPTALSPSEIASVDVFDGVSLIGTVIGAGVTFTTGILSVGDHSFTVVVNDTTGHKSALSNVFTATIEAVLAAPLAVSDLTGVVNP